MKQRKVWRYTCEFCKKSNCSKYHMAKHEKGCTNNPNRKCGACGTGVDVADLVAAAKQCSETNLEPLREVAEGCPYCMLTGIRQSNRQTPPTSLEDQGFWFEFDFKKEKESFWADENMRRMEAVYGH